MSEKNKTTNSDMKLKNDMNAFPAPSLSEFAFYMEEESGQEEVKAVLCVADSTSCYTETYPSLFFWKHNPCKCLFSASSSSLATLNILNNDDSLPALR